MATLNTLRTKGGAVLAVVIGVSLLAFLLGDLAGSGGILFNSSKMNVGRINGETVTYQEYLNRIERITRSQQIATGNENLNDEQTRQVRNAAWESIARELSFGPSLENLGLVVGPEELTDMATGEWISPVISSIFVNPQSGRFDPEMLNAYVSNLDADPTGNSRFFWKYIENEMSNERAMSKYMSLVAGGGTRRGERQPLLRRDVRGSSRDVGGRLYGESDRRTDACILRLAQTPFQTG